MAEHIEAVIEHSGVDKEIDSGALAMMMDNVQISQYSYPVKSTIREIVSNGVDSINEKLNAIAILSGKKREQDYYYVPGTNPEMDEAIKQNPGVYKDSRFDPDYYNLAHMSKDNHVQITYYEKGNTSKDVLVIRDNGVGLGDYRLHGYLKLGYSTKRLAKAPLGKYGIGAKSPLSMGVPYFEVISVHNGRRFRFLIYATHYESAIGPGGFDTEGNFIENEFINFFKDDSSPVLDKLTGEAKRFYWEPTSEKNYLEVRIDCKKHYKVEVQNAVASQLLYFENVKFTMVDAGMAKTEIPVAVPKMYEDEYLVISDNNQFSKPHIVVNNVCYGYIDFDELEIEAHKGNIGVKVSPSEIAIMPNRESLQWNDITRATIVRRIQGAGAAASKIIAQNLNQTDFMQWFTAANAVIGRGGNATTSVAKVLNEMRLMTKQTDMHPEFPGLPKFYYSNLLEVMFPGIQFRVIKSQTIGRKGKTETLRYDAFTVDDLFQLPVYHITEGVSPKQDRLMLDQLHVRGFITARAIGASRIVPEDKVEEDEESQTDAVADEGSKEWLKQQRLSTKRFENDAEEGIKLLLPNYPKYEEVTVNDVPIIRRKDEPTPEEIRKLESRIVLRTPTSDGGWAKMEPQIKVISTIRKDLFYGIGLEEEGQLLQFAAAITRKKNDDYLNDHSGNFEKAKELGATNIHHWNTNTKRAMHWVNPQAAMMLALIAKENVKYFIDDFYHISEFYNRFEDGIVTMADQLIQWNTARLIKTRLEELKFMNGMEAFNPTMYASFRKMEKYASTYYRSPGSIDITSAIEAHLDKLTQLQTFIRDVAGDEELVHEMTAELFAEDPNSREIVGVKAVDLEVLDELNALVEYAAPLKDMLNMVDEMTDSYPISYRKPIQEDAIRQYVDWRTS